MSQVTTTPRARAAHRTIGGYTWFALMVGGWVTFSALLAVSEPTLGELWSYVRGLPLVVEGLVWLGLFPFILALGVWDGPWETWLRLALVACFALG